MALLAELRRRGVLGAVATYGVAATGGLQVADVVVHALNLPAWSLRAMIWIAALGLPLTALVSWFYDLTRRGFVRTQAPDSPPLSPSPPLPSQMLRELQQGALLAGRYRLEGELGKGAMGRVLAARDEKLGRRVAVKVVTGAHDPARIQRFIQEARTAGSLEHPNVLAVYDLGEHEGVPFLVTELLEGHTLRTLLGEGALPPGQAQNLATQLAHGLKAAHARGIVHRDLKPENLFVTSDGRLKILDFGLARLITDESVPGLTAAGAVFGTPGYLSPEQARGEKAGPPSDVFSAGAVIYEMFSGRRAFPGANLIEAGHAALTAEPQPLPATTPHSLEGIIARALQKNAAKRFADGGELARALDGLAAGAPLPVPVVARGWRRSALMVSVAALAVIAAVASGIRVSQSARTESGGRPQEPHAAQLPPPQQPQPAQQPQATQQPQPAPQRQHPLASKQPVKAPAHPIPPPPPAPAIPPVPKIDTPDVDADQITKDVMKSVDKWTGNAGGKEMKGRHWGLDGLLSGVQALERANQPERAADLLRKQRNPLAHLELFLLLRKRGRASEGRADLLDYLKAHPDGDWPAPLLHAYAGTLPDQDVLDQARGDSDDLCEAYYYLGRLHAPSDAALARSQLQKAADGECDRSGAAREALQELPPAR